MKHYPRLFLSTAWFALLSSHAHAAGLAVSEQGVSVLGRAFSGEAAYVEDASIAYHNPAGMQYLSGDNSSFALHVLRANIDFTNDGSQKVTTAPITDGDGNDDESTGGDVAVPAFFYVRELDSGSRFGLSIYVPYGLGDVIYDDDWVGRYHSTESRLQTLNVSPGVSMQVSKHTSIGLTLDIQLADAKLKRAIDFDTACLSLGCTSNGDGSVELNGSGIGIGASFGLLHEFSDATTLGLTFRTQTSPSLDGDAEFTNVPSDAPSSLFNDGAATAALTLPDTLNLSLAHELANGLVLLGDIKYTQWSDFDEVTVNFEDDLTPSSEVVFQYQDTLRYSVGAVYPLSTRSTLRAGIAIDPTPVSADEYRNAANPDNDRTWFTLGASFALNRSLSIDLAYAHLDIPPADSANEDPTTSALLSGSFDTSADIVAAQINVAF